MPSFREQTPPPLFNKLSPPQFSHSVPSVFSNNTIPSQYLHSTPSVLSGSTSQYSENMIPPQYSNKNPHNQFSNPPTPAEQNSILSQTWLWVPHTKCSLVNDPNPNAVYLITLVTFDGLVKRFHLQPLTSNGYRHEIITDVFEYELIPPCEATFRLPRPPLALRPEATFHHRPLPLRPEQNRRVSSTSSVGAYGQALGIGISTDEALFQQNGASEFLFSQYGSASPRQYSNDRHSNGGRRRRESGYFSSVSDEGQSDRSYEGVGSRRRTTNVNEGGWRRNESKEQRSREGWGSGSDRESRGRNRGGFEDRDVKHRSGLKKHSGSGRKEGSRKDSLREERGGASKGKEKGANKERKANSRSSSSSSSGSSSGSASQSEKKKKK